MALSRLHELQYKKRIVAFLDVMGFKELLKASNLDHLRDFYGTADALLNFMKGDNAWTKPQDDFQSIFVSDSIVISIIMPDEKTAAIDASQRFFKQIALLQATLAVEAQIWMRGAVSVGDLYIDQSRNILVGPSFIRAFNLEQTADFPRVLVDPLMCRHFDLLPHAFVQTINSNGTKALMAPSNGMRWGGAVYMNDAIFIDWFFAAVAFTSVKLDPFFDDLASRMTLDHSIYLKSFKLLAYFRESLSEMKGSLKQPRFVELDAKLTGLGV